VHGAAPPQRGGILDKPVTTTAAGTADISYEDLYARWEQGNWSAGEIDFSGDRAGWEALTDLQRRSMRWQFAMFFNGEDAVTDNLSPYIDAAPKEEQKYFLATQQVDEARHTVFFARFFSEVLGVTGSVAEGLAACQPELNWGYRRVFDRLDEMADELRRDQSLPKFAQAITMYHLVVEASLAQPGQHFIEDYVDRIGTMPGFLEGMRNVARDEQRHIAFGVKTLSELFEASDECRQAVAELLAEVMPATPGVFAPPGFDRRYTEDLGFTLEEIYAFGFRSFESKLRAAGMTLDELPAGTLPLDLDAPHEERAATMVRMLELGLTADPTIPPKSDDEAQELLFHALERSADTSALNGHKLTIQWRFDDAPPWHVRVDASGARATRGEDPDAAVTLSSSWRDWLDVTHGRADPRAAVLRRKLRARGSPLALWRMQRIFPR
jgi:hypothetical protein